MASENNRSASGFSRSCSRMIAAISAPVVVSLIRSLIVMRLKRRERFTMQLLSHVRDSILLARIRCAATVECACAESCE